MDQARGSNIKRINQALQGIDPSVTAVAMNTLTGGAASSADALHRHTSLTQDDDSETVFAIVNPNTGGSAGVGVQWSLPNLLLYDTRLTMDRTNGFLRQTHDGRTFHLVGSVHQVLTHEGDLTSSLTGRLIGVAPIDGEVVDVIVSIGDNMVSSTSSDGVSAAVMVNGTVVTDTDPEITSNDGGGFRSTDQGDGTPAAVKTGGAQVVARGDVLTVDITRSAAGSVSNEASNVIILVVIRADQPE